MKVSYEKPVQNAKGEYSFEEEGDFHFLKVDSAEDVKRIQKQLLDITDYTVNFLRNYGLPHGIDGEAAITLKGYDAKKDRRLIGSKTIGVVGFPKIHIQTDLGTSKLDMYPDQNPMYKHLIDRPTRVYDNHINIEVEGEGLADKVVLYILTCLESEFSTRVLKTEDFGSRRPSGYINKRIIVPIVK